MSRKTILVLTASHLCKNPRVVKEATALATAGYDVTVMSVSSSVRFERFDQEMMTTMPFRRLTLDFTRPDRLTRARGLLSRGATWLARAILRHTHVETPDALGPARPLLLMARAFPADLTIVHTEAPIWAAQHLIGAGRRVGVDIEDWYSEDLLYADRRSRPLRLLRHAEHFVLNHAVYASSTSESMAAALAQAYRCPRPTVVRNTFPLPAPSRLDRPIGSTPPSLIWFSQTIGPGRGLELFAAAWNRTQFASRLYLLGDERPGYREHILGRIAPERRHLVGFLPLVAPADLPAKLAEFDLGLALEPNWPRNKDLTISNKIFHYLAAGLAVVSTDTAGQTEVMRAAPDSGLLVQAHETTRLATQLDELLGNPLRLRACQVAARRAAATDFSWDRDAPRLLAAVDRAWSATPGFRS